MKAFVLKLRVATAGYRAKVGCGSIIDVSGMVEALSGLWERHTLGVSSLQDMMLFCSSTPI